MATTDAKPGFRLPWSADRSQADQNDAPAADAAAAATADVPTTPDVATPDEETESPAMIDAAPAATTSEAAVDSDGSTAAPTPTTDPAPIAPAATAARKPNKFMADLTKAMQSAAESARADSIERLSVDAKAHVEASTPTPRTRPPTCASRPTTTSPPCASGRRPRSPASAKRPTSGSPTARSASSARSSSTPPRSRRASSASRAASPPSRPRWPTFFERLLAEDDPTRFAAMAESLPEPPPFDVDEPAAASEPSGRRGRTGRRRRRRGGRRDRGRRRDRGAEPTGWETTPDAVAEPRPPSPRSRHGRPTSPGLTEPAATADGDDLFSIGADEPAAERRPAHVGARPDPGLRRRRGRGRPFDAGSAEDGSERRDVPRSATTPSPLVWPASCRKAAPRPSPASDVDAPHRRRPRQRREHRRLQASTCRASPASGRRRVVRPRGRVRLPGQPRRGRRASRRRPEPAGLRRPRHRESDEGLTVTAQDPSPRTRPWRVRRRHRPARGRGHPGRDRAARGRLRSRDRRPPAELEALLTSRRDVAVAILDGETDFDASLEYYAPPARRAAGRSRPSWSSRRGRSTSCRSPRRWRASRTSTSPGPTPPSRCAGASRRCASAARPSTTARGPILQGGDSPSTAGPAAATLIAVFNPKGGVGKTTVATNLAAALQLRQGQRVLLIDADTVTGHVTTSLGMEGVRTVVDSWRDELEGGPMESLTEIAVGPSVRAAGRCR